MNKKKTMICFSAAGRIRVFGEHGRQNNEKERTGKQIYDSVVRCIGEHILMHRTYVCCSGIFLEVFIHFFYILVMFVMVNSGIKLEEEKKKKEKLIIIAIIKRKR